MSIPLDLVTVHVAVVGWFDNIDVHEHTHTYIYMHTSQVFPKGWDKTFCLQYLTDFDNVYFFGDKTYKGGNDHEIFESERTVGTSPRLGNSEGTARYSAAGRLRRLRASV